MGRGGQNSRDAGAASAHSKHSQQHSGGHWCWAPIPCGQMGCLGKSCGRQQHGRAGHDRSDGGSGGGDG